MVEPCLVVMHLIIVAQTKTQGVISDSLNTANSLLMLVRVLQLIGSQD